FIAPRILSASFNKNNDTTLANIPGMTFDLVLGKTYRFKFRCTTSLLTTGGEKYAVSGTVVPLGINYSILSFASTGSTPIQVIATALNTSGANGGYAASIVLIEGVITVGTAGTLTIQFAQSSASAGNSTVLSGASFEVLETE